MSRPAPDHIPAVKTVMTPFPHSVEIGAPLAGARTMMEEHDIRHLPVMDGDRLVGVISDRDVRLVESMVAAPEARARLEVRDACRRDPYVVDLGTPLDVVLLEMARRHIGSALITRHERLAGIFTVTDACRSFGDFLRAMFPRGGGDAA